MWKFFGDQSQKKTKLEARIGRDGSEALFYSTFYIINNEHIIVHKHSKVLRMTNEILLSMQLLLISIVMIYIIIHEIVTYNVK